MCRGGVKSKTIEDYIRDLANPETVDRRDKAENIIRMLHEEKARLTECDHRVQRELTEEIEALRLTLRALSKCIILLEERGRE